jgi:hypothetical protein
VVTAFVVVFALALVFVCALVLDGGRLLAAHREAHNIADSAARAGAQAVSEEAWRAGRDVILDPDTAHGQACEFLARARYACGANGSTVAVAGNEVTVTVRGSVDLLMLPGEDPSLTAHGSACVARGITGDEPTADC